MGEGLDIGLKSARAWLVSGPEIRAGYFGLTLHSFTGCCGRCSAKVSRPERARRELPSPVDLLRERLLLARLPQVR